MESQSHEATRSQGHKGPQHQSLKLQDRCGLGLPREHGPGHSDLRCLGPGTEWTSLLLPRHFGGPGRMVGGAHWEPGVLALGYAEGRCSALLMAQPCVDGVREPVCCTQ